MVEKIMKFDWEPLTKLQPLIEAVAESFELSPAVVGGILSRESGCGRLLGKGGNPPGTGDGGHGRGLMQVDDRYWKGFLNLDQQGGEEDAWRWPAFNLAFGCWLLRKNMEAMREHFPGLGEDQVARAALAAYNCGRGRVIKALAEGHDVDAGTTGGDYGRDVMARAEWLRGRGWK
jgi:hypothetical protein